MSFLDAIFGQPGKVRVEEEAATQKSRPDEPPVVLRANREYPLLVDPSQLLATEHFGVLRARLLNAYLQSGIRSVVITSPQNREGKTLVCTNLATCIAQIGKYRVLLVDGDLRVRGITQLFGIQDQHGLGDFLQGTATFRQCIRSTNLPCLWVAGAGGLSQESPVAILEGTKWPQFLELAKQEFDLMIIDSVPAGAPIADFELLSAACDAVLLIVHLRKTTRQAVDRTLQQVNSKLMGLIVNNAGPRVGYDHYYHGYMPKKKKV